MAQEHAQAGEAAAIRGARHCIEVLAELEPPDAHPEGASEHGAWAARQSLASHLLGLMQRA